MNATALENNTTSGDGWYHATALRMSRILKRLPGGRGLVDHARRHRLVRMARTAPQSLSRYDLDQLLLLTVGPCVQAGPFAGMEYLTHACGSVLAAKLLGTYESELHATIELLCQRSFPRVWVVGSGEGYYAVGLLRRMPEAQVWAFDTAADARVAILDLAMLNDVADRIAIGSHCRVEIIKRTAPEPGLIVCDIEGAEKEWLGDADPNGLRHCHLLVEVHDEPGHRETLDRLRQNFSETHAVHVIDAQPRDLSEIHWPKILAAPELRKLAVDEGRWRGTRWLLATPWNQ